MTIRRTARLAAFVTASLLLVVAAVASWFDARTRPDAVGPRFVARLVDRHPGATVEPLDGGLVRVALPSGIYVDARLSALFAACRQDRLDCSNAIDRSLGDIERAEALVARPERAALRPVVLAEAGGETFGYLIEPLIGPFQLRYALVSGLASTFVTGTIAGRLGLSGSALRDAAVDGLRQEGAVGLVRVDGPANVALFRVTSSGDPAASLVDPGRMRRIAAEVGARRLYAILPTRNALLLGGASDEAGWALAALRLRLRGNGARTLNGGVIAYDTDAEPGDALSIPRLPPAPLTR